MWQWIAVKHTLSIANCCTNRFPVPAAWMHCELNSKTNSLTHFTLENSRKETKLTEALHKIEHTTMTTIARPSILITRARVTLVQCRAPQKSWWCAGDGTSLRVSIFQLFLSICTTVVVFNAPGTKPPTHWQISRVDCVCVQTFGPSNQAA